MKRFTALIMVMVVITAMLTSCGDEKKTSSTQRSRRNDSTLTEQTLVEEIITEDIVVEEIEVHETATMLPDGIDERGLMSLLFFILRSR